MKSLLNKKRLPGILAAGLVALAVGAAGAPASASTVATTSGATVSYLTGAQKKAKKKALKKCKKKKPAKKAKKCKQQVNKKYKKIASNNPPPVGKTWNVGVYDNYFAPGSMNLKLNDAIKWSWTNVSGFEAHNVEIAEPFPTGVSKNQFQSQTSAVPSYYFKRQFTKPGNYTFNCTLHFGMTMTVDVSK